MMIEEGDGLQGQPAEGVQSLEAIAGMQDEGDEAQALPGDEEADDAEAVESEDEETSGEEEGEEGEEPKFTIKVDGKDIELSQSEIIELAQKGTDYSNKTMAVAKDREAITAERKAVGEIRQQHEQALQNALAQNRALAEFMQSQIGQGPDARLLDTDLQGYLRQKEQYEARKGKLGELMQHQHSLTEDMHRQRQAWIQSRAAEAEQALQDTLPGWNESKLTELTDYAGTLGLSPTSELMMLEPGFWQLADKAKKYDALQVEKSKLKPAANLKKVAKPQATNLTPSAAKDESWRKHKSAPSIASLSALMD